jgi:phosphoribosylformimino-5-aminoimidazole carboxamide ribotide isomerase
MDNARPFEILPAIDLRAGRVVRLRQGDFARETAYSDDPVEVARSFADAGTRWIHLVDLDGAREGRPVQGRLIGQILSAVGDRVGIEVAGGLRSAGAVARVLALGAPRAIIGTAALRDPALVGALVSKHGPDRIAVAIDVRDGQAVGQAWSASAVGTDAQGAISRLADLGVGWFEVTAIERDGLLEGPDLALYQRLVRLGRGTIIASGGIATVGDLRAVRELGAGGAIIGRALYERRLSLRDALAEGRD